MDLHQLERNEEAMIDPIKKLQEKLAKNQETASAALVDELPYEIALSPEPGAKMLELTIAGTYRTPIKVNFDPRTRVTYPVAASK
jgi:hypothetical protein